MHTDAANLVLVVLMSFVALAVVVFTVALIVAAYS